MMPEADIERRALQAATRGVERGLARITATAKELAPVRKVFGQYEKPYRVRLKTAAEIRGARDLRSSLGLGPENTYVQPPLTVARRAPQHLRDRRLKAPADPLHRTRL